MSRRLKIDELCFYQLTVQQTPPTHRLHLTENENESTF